MLAQGALILSLAGLGPVQIGMTERQAEQASGYEIRLTEVGEGCFQGRMGPASVLVRGGRIAVIGTARRNRVRTGKGIRVGDSRARLERVYGARLRSRPAPLSADVTIFELREGRRELHFVVDDASGRILGLEAGRRPEVDYAEGCA